MTYDTQTPPRLAEIAAMQAAAPPRPAPVGITPVAATLPSRDTLTEVAGHGYADPAEVALTAELSAAGYAPTAILERLAEARIAAVVARCERPTSRSLRSEHAYKHFRTTLPEVIVRTGESESQDIAERIIDAVVAQQGNRAELVAWGPVVGCVIPASVDPVTGEPTPTEFEPYDASDLGRLLSVSIRPMRKHTQANAVLPMETVPDATVAAVMGAAKHDAAVPRLDAIVPYPQILADGSIPGYGYSRAARAWIDTDAGSLVPANPTYDDVRAAVAALEEVVCDIPFRTSADRSAWFALSLTLVCKSLCGVVPVWAMQAPAAGCGKNLMVSAIWQILAGREAYPYSLSKIDDTELKKYITSDLLERRPLIFFDEVTGLGSGAIKAYATAAGWSDRILGQSKSVSLPSTAVMVLAGHSMRIDSDDLRRRILPVRIGVPTGRPYRHPDVLEWVEANRPRLLAAILTIARGYLQAGRPDPPLPLAPWGTYERWGRLIRGMLVWAGLDDPCESRADLERDKREAGDLSEAALEALAEKQAGRPGWANGFSAAALQESAKEDLPLRDLLASWLGVDAKEASSIKFATALGDKRDKPAGRLVLKRDRRNVGYVFSACYLADLPQIP